MCARFWLSFWLPKWPQGVPRGSQMEPQMSPERVILRPLCFPASVRGRLGIRRCPPRRKVSRRAPKWVHLGLILKVILSYFWSETECYSQAAQHAFLLAGAWFFIVFADPKGVEKAIRCVCLRACVLQRRKGSKSEAKVSQKVLSGAQGEPKGSKSGAERERKSE